MKILPDVVDAQLRLQFLGRRCEAEPCEASGCRGRSASQRASSMPLALRLSVARKPRRTQRGPQSASAENHYRRPSAEPSAVQFIRSTSSETAARSCEGRATVTTAAERGRVARCVTRPRGGHRASGWTMKSFQSNQPQSLTVQVAEGGVYRCHVVRRMPRARLHETCHKKSWCCPKCHTARCMRSARRCTARSAAAATTLRHRRVAGAPSGAGRSTSRAPRS